MVIHVGLDLVSVEAVAESLLGPHGGRYLARVYTDREIEDCRTASGIDPRRLAARFAAKEAVLKVLASNEAVAWRDIEVCSGSSGRVWLALHGRAAEVVAEANLADLTLSLSHDPGFAIAVVLADLRPIGDRSV